MKSGISEYRDRLSDSHGSDVRIIQATAVWCGFLQGDKPATHALKAIAESSGVEAITLVRMPHDGLGKTQSITFDSVRPTLGIPKISKSFAGMVLGDYARSAAPGTVWLQSVFSDGQADALIDLQQRRGWNEFAIIPLSQSPRSVDLIEMHFKAAKSRMQYLSLNLIASTLADTWTERKPGIMTQTLLERAPREQADQPLVPLLSYDNPAHLSRAEFRVCLLLSQGLQKERIMSELGISLATLRTHLRNIYAKTESDGHSELLYKLLSFAGERMVQTAKRA